mgnify:FL=1
MLIHGSCHCGNIAFDLRWEPEPAEIPARACGCSFCVKHAGVWTSSPTGSVAVTIADPARVTRYAFGTKTAVFHVCATCGVTPIVTCDIDGTTYAVVSVNAFDGVDPALIRRASSAFDGEDTQTRLARRKRNWIAHVEFRGGGA